jgi:hypothetical protein
MGLALSFCFLPIRLAGMQATIGQAARHICAFASRDASDGCLCYKLMDWEDIIWPWMLRKKDALARSALPWSTSCLIRTDALAGRHGAWRATLRTARIALFGSTRSSAG